MVTKLLLNNIAGVSYNPFLIVLREDFCAIVNSYVISQH